MNGMGLENESPAAVRMARFRIEHMKMDALVALKGEEWVIRTMWQYGCYAVKEMDNLVRELRG